MCISLVTGMTEYLLDFKKFLKLTLTIEEIAFSVSLQKNRNLLNSIFLCQISPVLFQCHPFLAFFCEALDQVSCPFIHFWMRTGLARSTIELADFEDCFQFFHSPIKCWYNIQQEVRNFRPISVPHESQGDPSDLGL